ncbi:hypothetical protein CUJ84_pRLN1000946 (plasmid) [Rhizobium leguminosarum]|uniref:Uncharacterized protein n=1 Tax=Rhizobium leguminosarum TaxID=384 RepID=A0A2K9ZDW0_RHILE|nr:hypothetical protein CUJ84_pRLN1000946 [Rhizobium leguminosarum]
MLASAAILVICGPRSPSETARMIASTLSAMSFCTCCFWSSLSPLAFSVTSLRPDIVCPCETTPLRSAVLNLSRSDIETPIVWALAAEIDIAKAMDASVAVFMNSPAQFGYESVISNFG